ncbi:SpoIID/LytB domain-containing protein [Salirhabdus salicampi]|uniref:SpoIID/LytB domain-containing protein n=1 Tax=Salirhabdus salicampi TaxID=476102 RepID=UPI0020C29659|nr:SpoIID/LytB domain-containing protein [Salirhabdus salicampi]MCP8615805.1 SpoIID/LytB domain-containing protein [Salirhabdus salicampi]
MRTVICLFTLFFIFNPFIADADEMVSVKLVNYIKETSKINIKIKGNYETLSPTLQLEEGVNYTLYTKRGQLYLTRAGEDTNKLGDNLILIPQTYDKTHLVYINDRAYLGAMEFTIEDKKHIRPINHLQLEEYLKGVVPFEVYPTWNMEALKAQSLAARTYAITQLNQNMDDTIRFQVYGGYEEKFNRTTKAVEETKGEIITFSGKPITAFYSASNGGMTESNENVWGGKRRSYFPIKQDPFDPVNPWEFTLHKRQIQLGPIDLVTPLHWNKLQEKDKQISNSIKNWLRKKGYGSQIKIIRIPHFNISTKDKTEGKRSTKGSITIDFMYQFFGFVLFDSIELKDVPLSRIRPMIGGTLFKSYLIDSFQESEQLYKVTGRGYGHGVGMSQWGAHYMAETGKNYKEIIDFYYPGTQITKLY